MAVNNRTIVKDQNQRIQRRHIHNNSLDSWRGLPIQAYSSEVPCLQWKAGVLIRCDDCNTEAWLRLEPRRVNKN